jgi:hypothetical protein
MGLIEVMRTNGCKPMGKTVKIVKEFVIFVFFVMCGMNVV